MIRAFSMVVLVALIAACKGGSGDAGAPAGEAATTPEAVARALAARLKARDAKGILETIHPDLREEYRGDLEGMVKDPAGAERLAAMGAGIEASVGNGFEVGPMPAKDARFGDQHATLSYTVAGGSHPNKLELARKDGRWYVGDID